MLTQDQIKANIDALEKQGAKPEEVQSWLDSQKGNVASDPPQSQGDNPLNNLPEDPANGVQYGSPDKGFFTSKTASGDSPFKTDNVLTNAPAPYTPIHQGSIGADAGAVGSNVGKALVNAPASFSRGAAAFFSFLGHVVDPRMSSGKNSVANIANIGTGAIETGAQKLATMLGRGGAAPTDQMAAFHQTYGALKQQYGSVENLARKATEDPVGLLVDVLTITEGGEGILSKAGEASEVSKAMEIANKGGTLTDIAKVGGSSTFSKIADALGGFNDVAQKVNPYSLAAKGVNKVAGAVGDKVLSPFSRSYNLNAEQNFADLGIDKPPLSAISDSNIVKQAEAIQAKGVFGGKIQDTFTNAATELQNKGQAMMDSLARVPADDPVTLGNVIKNHLDDMEGSYYKYADQQYDNFLKDQGNAKLPANTSNSEQVIQSIIEDKNKVIGEGNTSAEWEKRLAGFQGDNSDLAHLQAQGVKIPDDELARLKADQPKLTLENLKKTRTEVGKMIQKDPANSDLRRYYEALSNDMNETIAAKDPELAKQYQSLNQQHKNMVSMFSDGVSQKIRNTEPGRLLGTIIKPNNAQVINEIKAVVPTEDFQKISNSFLWDTISNSTKKALVDGEMQDVFDPTKFSKNIGKYDEATLKSLLDDKQLERLQEVRKNLKPLEDAQNNLKSAGKIMNGSQTAFLNKFNAFKNIAALFLSGEIGSAVHGAMGMAIGVAAYLGLDWGMTKFLTSEFGRDFLTKGLEIPKLPTDGSFAAPIISGGEHVQGVDPANPTYYRPSDLPAPTGDSSPQSSTQSTSTISQASQAIDPNAKTVAERLANAIAYTETKGRQVEGKTGELKSAFQFEPDTWRRVSKEMFGRVIPLTLANERKVAVAKISQLLKKYTPRQVALIWNTSLGGSEKPLIKKGTNGGVKYDSGQYANKVMKNLASLGAGKNIL